MLLTFISLERPNFILQLKICKPSMDKNSVLHPEIFSVVLCLFWKPILIFCDVINFIKCYLSVTNVTLTTDVNSFILLQNVLKNCVTVPEQSPIWCSTPKLQGSCFVGKCTNI